MSNVLGSETSPYLLQHAENPVHWQPWGDAALARARAEDKPLLVSIGYSACHWCHVMERESFEDERVAAFMNEHFVCVKVDREERPDVDALYMEAVQAMTGHGGWPLNAFATPDGVPFFCGTYYPPEPAQGMPSWAQVLATLAKAWAEDREQVLEVGPRVLERLRGASALEPSGEPLDPGLVPTAIAALEAAYDEEHGGFGTSGPKFPPHAVLGFLLGRGETRMSFGTLRAMANGGLYDQLGGGFCRYAVDREWVVPHFEKMLYDNALLARAFVRAWHGSGRREPLFRRVAEGTLAFMERELLQPDGGFASALDADSEGVEGRFYVWELAEVRAVLGDDADEAIRVFGMTEAGNFEGANHLVRAAPDPPGFEPVREKLLAARANRIRPGLDDKRLTAWNAMAIAAFAEAGAVLERPELVERAAQVAAFVRTSLRDEHGGLLRTYNRGRAQQPAFLEDHGHLLEALVVLYEASADPQWLAWARELADVLLDRFADPERGGFYSTAADQAGQLAARRKEVEDTPVPSGQSAAALGLLRLSLLTGEARYDAAARGVVALLHPIAGRHPQALGHLLEVIALVQARRVEVAIVGPPGEARDALVRAYRAAPRPHAVLAVGTGVPEEAAAVPLLAQRGPVDGAPAAYVCEAFACQAPVTDPEALEVALAQG